MYTADIAGREYLAHEADWLFEMFLEKSVAIVGPVPSDEIPKVDYVVRLNSHWVKAGRTDVIFNGGAGNPMHYFPKYKLGGACLVINNGSGPVAGLIRRCVLWEECGLYEYLNPVQEKPPVGFTTPWVYQFRTQFGTPFLPFTGVLAIELFRLLPVEAILVRGMNNFHHTQHHVPPIHDIRLNARALREIGADSRIDFCEDLKKAVGLA